MLNTKNLLDKPPSAGASEGPFKGYMDKMMHVAKIQTKPMARSEAFKVLNLKEDAETLDPEEIMTVKLNKFHIESYTLCYSAT